MIETLPLFHRLAGQPVVVAGEGEAAAAKRRLVERAGGVVVADLDAGITQGARLAFIACEEEHEALDLVGRARAAGLLVNATDRPALCDFTVPSILDRSPVLVAVGTGGASAGLAKHLRLRLEALLPPALGALARALTGARPALRQRFPDMHARRRALDAALAEGGALDPFMAGNGEERLARWLAGADDGRSGTCEIVLRSEDPDELTLREARWLGAADVVAFESGVSESILDRARADAARMPIAEGENPEPGGRMIVIVRAMRCVL